MASRFGKLALPVSVLVAAMVLVWSQGCTPRVELEPADLVLRGGKIATVDESNPYAQALAVRGDQLVAIGTDQEIAGYVGEKTRVLELEGRLAIPGFIEGHGHFLGVGLARMQLNLIGVDSWEKVIALVAEAVAKAEPGDWIEGRGWHQEKWNALPEPNVQGLPTHQSLSAISPDNPVVLRHASGHAVFANGKAMELGGVSKDTQPPAGGEIIHDANGQPIGVFRETASSLVMRRTPRSDAELRRQVDLATEECLEKGITSFQDAGSSFSEISAIKKIADEGGLRLRLWMMIRDSNERLKEGLSDYPITGQTDPFFFVGGIKHSIDGALGSHGAWLLEPYSDLPESSGLNTTSLETIQESAQLALEHSYQLCVHAIGDRANRETLDIFEAAYQQSGGKDLRWRVEHAQHLNPDEIPRFAKLGVIASMQAVHCTSDGPWVPTRLGDERSQEGAYLWRTLLDAGIVVTNGTDAPVEDVSALASYTSSVTRRMNNGEVFYGDQVMSREEALEAYTLSAAYSAHQADDKGSLVQGKLADITVLSQDILTVPDEALPATEVDFTIVGGKVEYERQ